MKNLLSTQPTSVETAKTKERWTWKKVLTTCALFWALILPWKASSQEQNSPEIKKDSIESVIPTQNLSQNSSTIPYDNTTWLKNEGKRIFTKDEILEIIKNNQEILNDTNINEVISEKLYENLLENEEMQEIIQEMVNSDYIKKAVIEWNDEDIQEILKYKLEDKFDTTGFFEVRWIISFICSILKFFRRLVVYPKN